MSAWKLNTSYIKFILYSGTKKNQFASSCVSCACDETKEKKNEINDYFSMEMNPVFVESIYYTLEVNLQIK